MSIYIGNDFEDRLKVLEIENALLKNHNEYHQVVHEIDHMSDLHLQSWTKYFEQTYILKKSLFSSLPLSNNVENVDNIHAGLAQLQHC